MHKNTFKRARSGHMYRNCACDYTLTHSRECVIVISVTWVHPPLWHQQQQEGLFILPPPVHRPNNSSGRLATHTQPEKNVLFTNRGKCAYKNMKCAVWASVFFNCLDISRWPKTFFSELCIQSPTFVSGWQHRKMFLGDFKQKQEVC